MTILIQSDVKNFLLASVAPEDFKRIAGELHPVELPLRKVLQDQDASMDFAYFPERGMVSLVTNLTDGRGIEVGLVGSEGFLGVPIILGEHVSPSEWVVQAPVLAYRIPAATLWSAINEAPTLLHVLLRFVQANLAQVSQTAACNGHHPIEQRLARWLLMSRDRHESDEMPLTQEFLAQMLGVRRPGINVALGLLKRHGVLSAGHGLIRIDDRKRLEAAACECYALVRRDLERLLASRPGLQRQEG
jgi:CRP-like cAMP-binding protein